jgi:hypothetical protein
MPAQLDPQFLAVWVRAELEASGEVALLQSLIGRAMNEGLDEDEAELDAAGQIAERRGWLDSLERASGDFALAEVREARGQSERLEKSSSSAAIAFLRATPGAIKRLETLAVALAQDPNARVAELTSPLGGTPGCSVR